jgi:hypothetical protein
MDLNQQKEILPPKKYSSIIKWSLIIGIVIVINMFFNYAISMIYSAPVYDNFCKQPQVIQQVSTQDACVAQGGQWDANYYGKPATVDEILPAGYCNLQYTCNNEFEAVRKVYERNVFVTLVILGIALLAGSFTLSFNWILSVSASMGGILSVIIASMRYWGEADNWLRVIILFIALLALIYFAVRKFKDN